MTAGRTCHWRTCASESAIGASGLRMRRANTRVLIGAARRSVEYAKGGDPRCGVSFTTINHESQKTKYRAYKRL